MRFRTICMLALVLGTASAANAQTRLGVSLSIGDAPPPPVIVVRQEPHVVYVPEARVYYVDDSRDDWFRVGTYWYIEREGYWYRASSYRGPYRVIEERYVPAGVWRVPAKHWKGGHPHGGPPGQMKKGYGGSRGHGRH